MTVEPLYKGHIARTVEPLYYGQVSEDTMESGKRVVLISGDPLLARGRP